MPVIKLAFASCLNAADSLAFDRIRALTPDYFYAAGDVWYDDGSTDHVAHWNAKFGATRFAAMLATLPNPPIVNWSDHDFGFAPNATAGAITTTANTAYRTKFGSTGLPTTGIYRTWTQGRVRFILCDERSFKSANAATDNSSKTVLGATQKAWLKDLLAVDTYPLIVVLGDIPWVGTATAGDDGWKGYATERAELSQAYAASPAQVIRLNGDMHCLGVGRGQFGIDRVWQAAPLHNDTTVKESGAGYTSTYPTNANEGSVEELFALVTIDDTGSQINCTYAGYSADGTQRLSDSLVVSMTSPTPTGPFPYTGFPDGVAYPAIGAGSSVVNVSSSAALTTALTNAAAGQRIVLANGTYSGAFSVTGKTGTATAGISIEAATTGGAVFGSGSTFTVKDSAHVTIKGLAFPYELSSGNLVQFRGASHHCRITRCLFGPTSVGTSGTAKSPMIYGGDTVEYIRVDHNEFRNKANPGNTILFDGNFTTSQVVKHIRIDHNYLHDIRPEVTNEKEPIRFGVSTMSKTSSYSVIERNLLAACICEPENISVKACNVRVSGNVVLRSIGGIVYRHGTDGVVSDNYIVDRAGTFGTTIGSGGFRVYDKNHEISHNYVDGVYGGNFQGPLVLDTGDAEGSSTNLSAHWRVVNATVKRNVLVGNPEGIRIGNNYSSAPTGCTISDNLVAQTPTGAAITQRIAPVSTTITGNLYGSTPAAIGLAQGGDTIWRRADYGPRLTYLQPADVGVTGDPGDSDGTGVLVGSNGGGGGPVTPVDLATAAGRLGWGAPLDVSDEFDYTGSPNSSKWAIYNGVGHDGNGRRLPARVTVDGAKLVGTGLANGDSFGLAHRLDQQFGRWEVRMRAYPTGPGAQVLGVGGVATPVGAILTTTDSTATLNITTSGTSSAQRVYDGQGHTVGQINIAADYVTVQNFRSRGAGNAGIYSTGTGNVIQNNDIAQVTEGGVGDINGITFFGDGTKILFNKVDNLVSGPLNGSHTDGIQSWNTPSKRSSSNVVIKGNWINGPTQSDPNYIHQGVTAEGNNATSGGGGGTGDSANWTIDGNYFNTYGNQVLELHDIQGVVVTRNTFAGNATKIVNSADGSTVTYYADNTVTGSYGATGVAVTSGSGPTTGGGNYHPVLIVWPQSEQWPQDGEYDFVELSTPGQPSLGAFMHFPHDATVSVQQREFIKAAVDTSVFHNYALEWTPDALVGYVDGAEWFRTSGGASSIRRDIQTMPSGHLTVQLDNFDGTTQAPATMEVEWARVYTLTSSGGASGPQSVAATGVASGEQFGIPTLDIAEQAPSNSLPTILGQNLILGSGTLGWTLSAVPPDPAGNQTVVGAGRIRSEQAFGVPSFTVPPGDQTITASSIPPGTTFGGAVISAIPAFPPAPGGVLVPALYAVGRDGTTLTPLPSWTKIHLSPVANSAGSLSVDYPAGAPGFQLLHDAVSASPLRALEIRIWLGGSNSAALGGWLVQKSGDDLTPGSSWTFSGHFHEWLLSKALVYPQTISEANKTGALTFAGATAGLILSTIMTQAQARGALPLVTRDFTATHDSNGTPWATSISSAKFAPKTKVSEIADKLVDLDMVEYELTPARMWRAYNPGGRGVDRTVGTANPLSFTATVNLRERARRESARDAGTAILVAGAEGFYGTASSATAQAELGWRAEVAADAGQLNSQSAVTAVTQSYLEAARTGTAEFNSGVEFVPGQPLPLIDYGVGDWAYVRAGARYERQRIAQIELDFAVGALPTGTIVQNDLITDKVTALYRRLNAISAGDAVVGTSESTPGGAGEDINPPAAPTGVTVASTFAYQVPGETLTLAEIGVGWAPVTTNAYVDDATAAKAKAAPLIAEKLTQRLLNGIAFEFEEDWSGIDSSITDVVRLALLDEWKSAPSNDGGDENTRSPAAQAWLSGYATAHLGGGAITGDVDHYRVQFQYLGAIQVNTKGPRGEDFPDQLQPDGAWEEPINSPTTATTLTFGNVEGGRAVGVRVAAVDRSGNQGPWSTVVAVDSASDDVPPPTPSKPIAAAWFRTMDITWDGKGSAGEDMLLAAPDFASGGYVEVHVDLGIDFDPDRPVGATGQVDLSASRTFKERLYAAGTTNVVDLQVGTTYFARFVAVDRNGNASPPSETSDGVLPKQLVNIDIGPDAISRVQIIDGEIVRAKIADLAVNDAKIESLEVGKLRAGTMTANVVIGGRFSTPMVNGNQVQIDNAGIRLYQGNTVIGRWQVSDASMLVTGTYLSALSGRRINILPSGTMLFYPSAGTNFGFLENLDGDLRLSGQFNQDNRAGYLLIDETRAALTYSQVATYNKPRARFQVDPIAAASWAPIISARIDRSLGQPDSLGPRWLYTNFSASGDIGTSIVHLQQLSAASNHAVMYGANSDAGIVFDSGFIGVVHNNINPADVHASGFIQVSALAAKRDVAPVRFGSASAARITQLARARSFYYHHEFEARPESPGTMLRRFDEDGNDINPVPGEWTHPPRRPVMHVGPMADDLLAVAPQIVHTDLPQRGTVDNGGLGLSVGTVAGLAYAAAGELADAHDALVTEVATLRARLDCLDASAPIVVDGTLTEDS